MAKKISKTKDLGAGFADSVSHGRVKDVTSTNYAGKAAAVAAKVGGKQLGFMICPIDNPKEWGAWRSYLKGIDRYQNYMSYIGQQRAHSKSASRFWVPTAFPHQFDSDRLELTDDTAADHFVKAQMARRAQVGAMGTEEERMQQAQDAIRRVREGMKLPRDHNHRRDTVKAPVLPDRDPKRWHDKKELKASRDRMFKRLGMALPEEEKDDAKI